MNKKTIKAFLSIKHEIIAMGGNIAFIKVNDKYAIVEHYEASIGSTLNYHYFDKYDCNLLFRDYSNQVVYKGSGQLNFWLVDK